jgi:hypothetical protein
MVTRYYLFVTLTIKVSIALQLYSDFSCSIYVTGDGVVPLESTKLDGVKDWRIVKGNHHTIVKNIFSSEENPPAVDVVIELLSKNK